jgi:hypothetical protein
MQARVCSLAVILLAIGVMPVIMERLHRIRVTADFTPVSGCWALFVIFVVTVHWDMAVWNGTHVDIDSSCLAVLLNAVQAYIVHGIVRIIFQPRPLPPHLIEVLRLTNMMSLVSFIFCLALLYRSEQLGLGGPPEVFACYICHGSPNYGEPWRHTRSVSQSKTIATIGLTAALNPSMTPEPSTLESLHAIVMVIANFSIDPGLMCAALWEIKSWCAKLFISLIDSIMKIARLQREESFGSDSEAQSGGVYLLIE